MPRFPVEDTRPERGAFYVANFQFGFGEPGEPQRNLTTGEVVRLDRIRPDNAEKLIRLEYVHKLNRAVTGKPHGCRLCSGEFETVEDVQRHGKTRHNPPPVNPMLRALRARQRELDPIRLNRPLELHESKELHDLEAASIAWEDRQAESFAPDAAKNIAWDRTSAAKGVKPDTPIELRDKAAAGDQSEPRGKKTKRSRRANARGRTRRPASTEESLRAPVGV
jgi:hypothetical protein